MMTFDDDLLREVVDSVCLPLLGMPTLPGHAPGTDRADIAARDAASDAGHDFLAARVEIDGAWEGTVELSCTVPLLDRVAAAMFGCEPDAVEQADREDTLTELANLVGGTAKSQLPGPSTLGLPEMCPVDTSTAARLTIDGIPIYVSVYGFEALATG